MLTTDLLRVRIARNRVQPQYLDPARAATSALAEELVGLYASHVGRSRGELNEAVRARVGEGTDFLLFRGLAKLLSDRSTFEVAAPCEPTQLRRTVFEIAARVRPWSTDHSAELLREGVFAEAGGIHGLDARAAERALYADLEDAHILSVFHPIDPLALVHRYNMALAQAVLLRARSLTVTLAPGEPARYRQLFRYVKFYRLMHAVRGTREAGYTITLDGPASLFERSSKYGLQLAEFLPALVLCSGWTLEADLDWPRRADCRFVLDPSMGLVSHYPDTGVYVTDEETFFAERFAAAKTQWQLERSPEIVDLGGRGVLVPDYVIRHADDGREALFEIVGFWRKGYLESRVELLRAHGPTNLVLALSTRLRADSEELGEIRAAVVFFRDVIVVREVLECVLRVATVPRRRGA